MTKDEVAASIDEIGTLLELKGENSFRCNAYHNGARKILQIEGDLKQMIEEKKLGDVPGIGEALLEKITTLVTTAACHFSKNSGPPSHLAWWRC